ncbi:MAG: serine/threonine-protein kinase [Methanoregulaceae archaeon PtaU1.Bin222]|nr:MAG: serine/threonine-protein kinase [Methanoregulaceae archaeon PtaU1.Bin222]
MPRYSSSSSIILLVLALLMVAPAVQAADTYTITAGAGDGGSIYPSGAVSVEKGSSQAFIIEAFYGFRIQNVRVDQKSLGSIPMYTFTDVNHNHEITAIFEPIYGSLKVSSDPSGAIVYIDNTYYGTTSPDGPVTFSGIIPGIHSVRFVLQGYQEYRVDVQIPAGETAVLPKVELVPIATTAPTTTPTTSPTTTVPTTTFTTPPTTTVPTTTFTTPPTAVSTTSPATTVPLTTVTSPPPTSLPVQEIPGQPLGLPAIPGIFFILAIGGLATIILSRDVLSSERVRNVSVRRKLLEFALFAIPVIAMMIVLDWYLASPAERTWGILPELVTAVVPLMLYLVLSSIALMMGALISWPFRGMLKAHTVAGVLVIFLALLALIGGDPSMRFMAGMMLLSGILSTLAARWQDGSYPQDKPSAGDISAPASISRPGPDETSVSTSIGSGLFPQELADKYAGAEFVGSGGLARVFRAKNLQTGQTVALKIPLQHDENTGKAFLKEIMGWEGLLHENIVKVSAVNILPVPYVEMEFIGQTLADMGKPLPMGRSARICRDVALGLQFAHDRGIIHRDIKPQNILVTTEGVPKITDWGMSKVIGLSGMPTITGFSLAYAAPEQLAPQTFGETDQRTDIYQLGCVLYELVTGVVPFPGNDMAHVSALIISQKPDLPSSRNPSLQPLDAIIMRCLEKRPVDRYQNVRELIHDLEEYLSSRESSDRYNIFED